MHNNTFFRILYRVKVKKSYKKIIDYFLKTVLLWNRVKKPIIQNIFITIFIQPPNSISPIHTMVSRALIPYTRTRKTATFTASYMHTHTHSAVVGCRRWGLVAATRKSSLSAQRPTKRDDTTSIMPAAIVSRATTNCQPQAAEIAEKRCVCVLFHLCAEFWWKYIGEVTDVDVYYDFYRTIIGWKYIIFL